MRNLPLNVPFHLHGIPLALRIAAPLAVSALVAAGCSSNATPAASGGGATTQGAPTSAAATGGGAAAGSVTVDAHSGPDGTYLTDSSGHTLYLFMADTSASSMCSSACASTWPPLMTTGAATAGTGVTGTDLSTITRSDGTKQVAYDGHPLYYFAHDANAGQTNGQGINGYGARWWIVSPSGAAITTAGGGGGASTPAPSGSSTKSGGSGWA